MAAKKKVSIGTAKAQLEQAIQADKSRLLDELTAISNELEDLVGLVGWKAFGSEVKGEIEKLARLFELQKGQKQTASKNLRRVKTSEKREFIARVLKANKGQLPKAELLELAAEEFRVDPSLTFLDTALDDKRFGIRRDENDSRVKIIVLVK